MPTAPALEQSPSPATGFVDRRSPQPTLNGPVRERRQFANSHAELSPEAAELAHAVDAYKLHHRRRFVTFEEVLSIVKSLGYSRQD